MQFDQLFKARLRAERGLDFTDQYTWSIFLSRRDDDEIDEAQLAKFFHLGVFAATGAFPRRAFGVDDTKPLRVAMHGDLRSFDPVWTTAAVTGYHSALIYDKLFGVDEAGNVQPQMVASFTRSDDGLRYDFALRHGLAFSDGCPETATDRVWTRHPSVTRLQNARSKHCLSPLDPPKGCAFHTCGPHVRETCRNLTPALTKTAGGQMAACHYSDEIAEEVVSHA